jgi:anti-sigma factor RsiW
MTTNHEAGTLDEACGAWVGLIVRAADGALDEADQGRLDAHLRTCAHCGAALARQREAHDALAAWPVTEASPEFTARLLVALDEDQRGLARWDFRRWTWRLAPLAAALALVAYVVVGQTAAVLAEPAGTLAATDPPVSAAIWSESVSEGDLVSLLLTASPDDSLTDALEESPQ